MKKILSILALSLAVATVADAGSIGRSGGSSSSSAGRSSSSFSSGSSSKSSSYSAPAPSRPSVAPAPSQSGGIGGTQSSVGVRKSEVTNGVRQDIARTNPDPGKMGSFSTPVPNTVPHSAPAPAYSTPAPVVVQSGGGFGSSFMGAMGGTIVGNALFGNHGNGGGTTVINNGTPSGGVVQGAPVAQGGGYVDQSTGQVVQSAPVAQSSGVSMGSIILNVIMFAILVAVIVGVCLLFYKGFKMLREYANKERGVSNIPFNPTQRFWEIQKAFAAADVTSLNNLLGPDVVDEMTNGLQPSTLTLRSVSHEVRLANNTEFSIWYRFEDGGEEVNQVWHYEKFGGGLWKLNGIENV